MIRWSFVSTYQTLIGKIHSIAPFDIIISNVVRLLWFYEGGDSRTNPLKETGYDMSMAMDNSTSRDATSLTEELMVLKKKSFKWRVEVQIEGLKVVSKASKAHTIY